jgi:hypothetical protein
MSFWAKTLRTGRAIARLSVAVDRLSMAAKPLMTPSGGFP